MKTRTKQIHHHPPFVLFIACYSKTFKTQSLADPSKNAAHWRIIDEKCWKSGSFFDKETPKVGLSELQLFIDTLIVSTFEQPFYQFTLEKSWPVHFLLFDCENCGVMCCKVLQSSHLPMFHILKTRLLTNCRTPALEE